MPAQALVENRGIGQHLPSDRGVIYAQAALRHHFFQISVAERILKIPSDAKNNDLVSEGRP